MTAAPAALVVAPDPADRDRVARWLRVAGWAVHEAAGSREALHTARRLALDLVVTDLAAPPGEAAALLRRLRLAGCRAHLLVLSADADADAGADPGAWAAARAAGALACLPRAVDAGLLADALRARLSPDGSRSGDHGTYLDADLDGELLARLRELYAGALPGRLTAIRDGARSGDPAALATASHALAGTSAQLGHPEVALVCRAIARHARRGVLAHHLVAELHGVARDGGAGGGRALPTGPQPTSR